MKVSPHRFYWVYAFGPIGKYGRELKRYGFWKVTGRGIEPELGSRKAAWMAPTGTRRAADLRRAFPNFPGKFIELTDAQRTGHGPGNPCRFTAMQISNAT